MRRSPTSGKPGSSRRQIGIVGFCMGGSVVFLAAARRSLGAGVTFYGGGVSQGRFGMPPLIELAAELKTPWLGLYGDSDQSIPVDDVEALRAAVAAAPVPTEIVRYPDADHGFHCDARSSYHEASAKDGWRRTLEWLGSHLAGGVSASGTGGDVPGSSVCGRGCRRANVAGD